MSVVLVLCRPYHDLSDKQSLEYLMAGLSGLKLVAAPSISPVSAVQQRRMNLVRRLAEQIDLAKSQAGIGEFSPKRIRTIKDPETGARRQVETTKRVKAWWSAAENGKTLLTIRYGARPLELAKGKSAVELGSDKELVPVLETVKAAVLAGDLDDAILAAARRLKQTQ
jgi:hypothetical protein